MAKNVVQKVKGTRDFYPEQMAFRKWLYGKIQTVSEMYGYQEYDGPEIERLEMYAEKTSEEIVRQQTFILKDRDDRLLALRPELTPTFARMVAQKAKSWSCRLGGILSVVVGATNSPKKGVDASSSNGR